MGVSPWEVAPRQGERGLVFIPCSPHDSAACQADHRPAVTTASPGGPSHCPCPRLGVLRNLGPYCQPAAPHPLLSVLLTFARLCIVAPLDSPFKPPSESRFLPMSSLTRPVSSQMHSLCIELNTLKEEISRGTKPSIYIYVIPAACGLRSALHALFSSFSQHFNTGGVTYNLNHCCQKYLFPSCSKASFLSPHFLAFNDRI